MKYFFANFKLYIADQKQYELLINEYQELSKKTDKELIIFPPLSLSAIPFTQNLKKGAQDFDCTSGNAQTGNISLSLLRSSGVTYVLIGHSKVRARGEALDARIKKLEESYIQNIIPVFCIGEGIESANKSDAWNAIKDELQEVREVALLNPEKELFIAYEPIWAIGSKEMKNPTAEHVLFLKEEIQKLFEGISIKILYGGSVNTASLSMIHESGVDGVLVGRSSLDITEVTKIIEA